ncbi:MAG: ATP-binding protein [Gammaproteobacteria bacterium]
MIRNWSIRNRVLLLALLPVITLGVLLSSYFVHSRVTDLKAAQLTLGRTMADQLASASLYGVLTHNPEALQALAQNSLREPSIQSVTISDSAHQVLAQVQQPIARERSFTDVLARRIGAETGFQGSLTFSRPILRSHTSPDGDGTGVIGTVTVRLSETHFAERQAFIIMSGALILALCLAFSILLALVISRSVVAPIERLIGMVQRFNAGEHGIRVAERSGGELRQLETGINRMAASAERSQQELQEQVDQATAELRGTLEEFEIKSVELDLARKRALEASRVKSEFLANMSHEVRTPMNAVLGFGELLARTPLNAGQRGYLATIRQSAGSLLALLDNILDASRLEMGASDIRNSRFVLRSLLEDIVSTHAMDAYAKQLELVLDTDGNDLGRLEGDRIKLLRVLTNLMSNAIKFTDTGTVTLSARAAAPVNGKLPLTLEVTDTGIGISTEDQRRLFQEFSQVRSAADRQHEGAGLGLFISKRLVQLMGGTLTLESSPGQGSKFRMHIALPVEPLPALTAAPGRGRLLVYEPNPEAATALGARLARLGWSAELCADAADLRAACEHDAPGEAFAALLLGLSFTDLRNPHTLTTAVPQCVRSLPRLALVNSVNTDLQAEVGRQLSAFCMAKCVSEAELGERLEALAFREVERRLPAPPRAAVPLGLDGHTLAVADDNRINRLLERLLLEKYGARVLEARNGKELLTLVEHNPVSLILLDMQMPDEDGWQVAAKLKAGLAGQLDIPVIALSAMRSDKSSEELQTAGLSGWLMKPLEEPALRELVLHYLHAVPAPQAEAAVHASANQGLDVALGRLRPVVRQMLRADLPEQQRAIEAALQARDLEQLRQQVHKLNGSAAFCGLAELRSVCTGLEQRLRAGNADQLEAQVRAIAGNIATTLAALERGELSPSLPS